MILQPPRRQRSHSFDSCLHDQHLLALIVDTLRAELANYGGLLHLFEQQQRSLFARDASSVLEIGNVIEAEARGLAETRHRRERTVSEFAVDCGLPERSSLRDVLPYVEANARPLLEALVGEVNRLLHKVRRISRHNHELLARTIEMHQETLQQLRPESFAGTYSPGGRAAGVSHPVFFPPRFGLTFLFAMGLLATFNSPVDALAAHSRAIETAGKNLANVDNPNYARQRVKYTQDVAISSNMVQDLGLQAEVQQVRDKLLDKQVTREISRSSLYTAQQSAYQRAQSGLGERISSTTSTGTTNSQANSGISAALDDFFNSFQTFAANPTSTAQRQALLQNATILTDRMQNVSQDMKQMQDDLDTQIATDVTSVNTLLTQVADLNVQIGRLEITKPDSAIDLRDQRQGVLEELAKKLNFETTESANGQIAVTVKNASNANVTLVSAGTVQGGVSFNGTVFSGGSPASTLALTGGSLEGALSSRDGGVQDVLDSLDKLASQLVTSVNQAYNPLGSTGNFFKATGTTAGAIQIDSTVTAANLKASDGGASGDNTIARAVAALVTKKFSTAGSDDIDDTFGQFLSQTVSQLGQSLSTANTKVASQETVETLVRNQRDSVSGVSLDEEMADLVKYQRAFQASSRVFNTVSELLDLVVNGLGK